MNTKTSDISLPIVLISLLVCLIAAAIFFVLAVSGAFGPLAYLTIFIIGLDRSELPQFILQTVGSLAIIGFVVYTIYSLNKK